MTDRLGPALAAPLFERIAIIGVGLIGSSIARAARRKAAAKQIAIADCSRAALDRAGWTFCAKCTMRKSRRGLWMQAAI